jgi:hypothetical protein
MAKTIFSGCGEVWYRAWFGSFKRESPTPYTAAISRNKAGLSLTIKAWPFFVFDKTAYPTA